MFYAKPLQLIPFHFNNKNNLEDIRAKNIFFKHKHSLFPLSVLKQKGFHIIVQLVWTQSFCGGVLEKGLDEVQPSSGNLDLARVT